MEIFENTFFTMIQSRAVYFTDKNLKKSKEKLKKVKLALHRLYLR